MGAFCHVIHTSVSSDFALKKRPKGLQSQDEWHMASLLVANWGLQIQQCSKRLGRSSSGLGASRCLDAGAGSCYSLGEVLLMMEVWKEEKQPNWNWGLYKHSVKCVTGSMSTLNSCAQYVNYSRLEFEIQITGGLLKGGTNKSYASRCQSFIDCMALTFLVHGTDELCICCVPEQYIWRVKRSANSMLIVVGDQEAFHVLRHSRTERLLWLGSVNGSRVCFQQLMWTEHNAETHLNMNQWIRT